MVVFSATALVMAASALMMAVVAIATTSPNRAFDYMLDQTSSAPHCGLTQADHAPEERNKPRLRCRIFTMLTIRSMVVVHNYPPVHWPIASVSGIWDVAATLRHPNAETSTFYARMGSLFFIPEAFRIEFFRGRICGLASRE